MNHQTLSPPLTDKAARNLGRQIAKDSSAARVKFGKTNGLNVLHVFVPGRNDLGRTISAAAEWELHPANERARKSRREEHHSDTELIITHNGNQENL